MIVSPKEIENFSAFLDEYEQRTVLTRAIQMAISEGGIEATPQVIAKNVFENVRLDEIRQDPTAGLSDGNSILAYLRNNPHLLIASGFDEIRVEPEPARQLAIAFHRELRKRGFREHGQSALRLPSHEAFEFMLGLHCRDAASGVWYRSAHVVLSNYSLSLRPTHKGKPRQIAFRDIAKNCRDALSTGVNAAVLLLPNLWYPPSEEARLHIADSSRELVLSLKEENKELSDLSWQQLEEVVAEVLRAKGFEILVTPRSGDGGRDIVARGEMVPGESALLAVEVKHRPVVKLPELRSHLHANKDFPMLLVATSGRFTAGVLREKQKPENFLRLHLRDGDALSSWIRDYS